MNLPAGQVNPDSTSASGVPRNQTEEQLSSDWLRTLAVIMANIGAYGPEHPVTRGAIDQSYHILEEVLKTREAVELRVMKDGPQINGRPCRTSESLEKKLRQLPVQSLAMNRGMSREDFGKLAKLIYEGHAAGAPGDDGAFFSRVNAAGIRNLSAKKSQFVELKETEVIISKEHLKSGPPGRTAGAGEAGASAAGIGTPVIDVNDWAKQWEQKLSASMAAPAAPVAPSKRTGSIFDEDDDSPAVASPLAPARRASSAPVFPFRPAIPGLPVAAPAADAPPAPAASAAPAAPAPVAVAPAAATVPAAVPAGAVPSTAEAPAAAAAGTDDTVSVQLPAAAVGQIIAFLKGSADPVNDEEAGKAVREVAGDASQLASLILQAVDVRQKESPLAGGEALGDIVVGCLRRAVDGMKQAPGGQTLKAQKETIRALNVVEAQVVDQMRQLAAEDNADADVVTVQNAVKTMKLQVEAESVAAQFAKQQSATEDTEKNIAKLIARNGPAALEAAGVKELLLQSGLTPEGWNRLVAAGSKRARKGGKAKSAVIDDRVSGDDGDSQLSAMLANLATALEKTNDEKAAGGEAAGYSQAFQRVDGEMARLIAQTDSKIDALAEAARKIALAEPKPEDSTPAGDDDTSRRRLLALMAEVVREFRQPLSVINSSVGMLQTPGVGTLSPVQEQLVALVGKSQTRIGSLAERLEKII